MKKHAKLPIICPTHETPEHTAPFPMTANAVSNIVAHKLARNTAANSTEDLIGSDEASQAEPLICYRCLPRQNTHEVFRSQPTSTRKQWPGSGARDKFATKIDKHENRTLVIRLDLKKKNSVLMRHHREPFGASLH